MDPLVRAALEQLRSALVQSHGRRAVLVQIVYTDGGIEQVTLAENGNGGNATPPPGQAAPGRQRTPEGLRQAVCDVLEVAERPMKAAAIAAKARRDCSSYFRNVLTEMVHEGLLVKPRGGGFWLASRDLPDAPS